MAVLDARVVVFLRSERQKAMRKLFSHSASGPDVCAPGCKRVRSELALRFERGGAKMTEGIHGSARSLDRRTGNDLIAQGDVLEYEYDGGLRGSAADSGSGAPVKEERTVNYFEFARCARSFASAWCSIRSFR